MNALGNLRRRRLRSALTVLGITIGIWALVVFSSMANKINGLVGSGSRFYEGKLVVSDASGDRFGMTGAPMQLDLAEVAARVPGVEVVAPQVKLLLDRQAASGLAGPEQIVGTIPGADRGHEAFVPPYAQGRALAPSDEGTLVVVLGADLARKHGAGIGDSITLRTTPFQVVGVLEPTLTFADSQAFVPLAAAQDLYVNDLPPLVSQGLDPRRVVTELLVYPTRGSDVDVIAAALEAALPNIATMTSTKFGQQVSATTVIFNAIIVGVALISLVVGGLSVVNTMAMSVSERTREIGVKRAIGASRRRIVREIVAEAGLIGVIGGTLGLALGAAVVLVANALGRGSGTVLFDLTPTTAVFAVAFSTVLGMFAGVLPAWHAARLDPVVALRYE